MILIGIGGVASWLAESPKVGGYFAGGLVTSLIALTGVAWLLLRGIRVFLKRSPWRIPSLVRQRLANLYRQGNQAQAILVALGLGVMFTLSVYLIQDSLVGQIIRTAPPGMPNVFMIGITQAQVEPLKGLLVKQAEGVEGSPEFVPSVSARLVSINGAALADMKLQGMARRFTYSRSVMWEDTIPEQTKVVEGKWWQPGTTEPVVSIAEDAAHALNLHPGAWIEMTAAGRTIGARVVAVHQTEAIQVERGGARVRVQPEAARRAAGDVPLRRRADEAADGGCPSAGRVREVSDGDSGERGGRARDRAAGSGSDRAGDPVSIGVRDFSGRCHISREHRGDAVPQGSGGRDPENAGCDSEARWSDILGRVSDAGSCRGDNGSGSRGDFL